MQATLVLCRVVTNTKWLSSLRVFSYWWKKSVFGYAAYWDPFSATQVPSVWNRWWERKVSEIAESGMQATRGGRDPARQSFHMCRINRRCENRDCLVTPPKQPAWRPPYKLRQTRWERCGVWNSATNMIFVENQSTMKPPLELVPKAEHLGWVVIDFREGSDPGNRWSVGPRRPTVTNLINPGLALTAQGLTPHPCGMSSLIRHRGYLDT